MRKIKICVATLLMSGFSYGQSTEFNKQNYDKQTQLFEEAVKEFRTMNYLIEEIVDNLRKDIYYGKIMHEQGNYYINEVMIVRQKNQEIINKLWLQRSKALGEYSYNINCENCDEID